MAKRVLVNLDMSNNKIVNLTSPTAGTDGANKDYVDGVARGLKYKTVRARATGNVTISTLDTGQVLDGVTLAQGDLVLLDQQTTATEDGIYLINADGQAATRATGPNGLQAGDDARGLAVSVAEGTANGDKTFVQTAEPAVVGTNGLTFGQLGGGGASGGAGMTSGFDIQAADTSVTVGTDDIAVNLNSTGGLETSSGVRVKLDGATLTRGANGLSVTTPVDSTVARVFTEAGSGTSTTHTMTHGLGKQWVVASCYLIASEEEVEVDVVATDTNTTTFIFGTSVDKSLYRFVVVG